MLESAGPSVEGPPGCESVARSSIFHLRLQWNHMTALVFSYFHILEHLKGQSFIQYVSSLMSQVLFDGLLYPTRDASPSTHHIPWTWDDPRITMKIHQFSSQSPRQEKPWKLVPRLPKIMKNRPWNHKKSNFCESWFLQYFPCQMLVFPIPDTQI